ncbi:MAG: hypothetical protein WBC91_17875 [Phototrophicaceae bacterium]
MNVILAHGVLGWYDELIFLGVIVIFFGLMFISWFRSRGDNYETTDLMPPAPDTPDADTSERFQLD